MYVSSVRRAQCSHDEKTAGLIQYNIFTVACQCGWTTSIMTTNYIVSNQLSFHHASTEHALLSSHTLSLPLHFMISAGIFTLTSPTHSHTVTLPASQGSAQ